MIYPGETVKIVAVIKDADGNLIDPASHEIKIYDPSGTLKETSTSPTKSSTGNYYLFYTLPEDASVGKWKVVWKAVKDSSVSIEKIEFYVAPSP